MTVTDVERAAMARARELGASVLGTVGAARRLADTGHLRLLVEIDGGINADTITAAAEAGVDCFVAGSAVYGADEPARAVAALRDRVREVTPHRWAP